MVLCLDVVAKCLKLTGLFTFVQEYIMSITGNTTKDYICVSGVPFVNSLGLYIKPVLMRQIYILDICHYLPLVPWRKYI